MGTMTHIAGRAAFSKAVDIVLKNADKDREKEITKLVDLMEKYMGSEKIDVDYNKVKEAVDDTKGQIVVYDGKPILPLYFSILHLYYNMPPPHHCKG